MPKTVCTASARWVPGRIRAILHQKSIQALLVGDVYGSQLQTSPVLFFRLTMCIIMTCLSEEALFIPGIFFWGGGFSRPKELAPFNGYQIVCSKSFWPGQWITNISRKLSFNGQYTRNYT